jgi:hypothetical protein
LNNQRADILPIDQTETPLTTPVNLSPTASRLPTSSPLFLRVLSVFAVQ